MGEAYQLNCGRCSYKQEVFLGIGFRYCSLSMIQEWYEEEEGKKRIAEFIQHEEETTYDCFDGLYVCQSCGYLLNAIYLHMESAVDTYTNRYACPRCSAPMPPKPMEYIPEDAALNCPDCRKEKLTVQAFMDWD